MSDRPVTIREHIHQALLAAGPVGLTMAALVEAVAGPWSPSEVKDSVRRLWQVGELARRHDGTFVFERANREGDAAGRSRARRGGEAGR